MLFRRRKQLTADLGALEPDDMKGLTGFLRSSLKTDLSLNGNKVSVDSERVSPDELKRVVNKYVYHRNLNHTYWVALEGDVVRVNKFEKAKKQEKPKKGGTPPQTIAHGW